MGIHGLLPPAILSQDIQALRVMANFHRAQSKISILYKFFKIISINK